MMQKISPCFWCDNNAEELARLYTSLFKNSKITDIMRAPADYPSGKQGQVLLVTFELEGNTYCALNGGPYYKATPAVSLYINCDTQEEVDTLWDKLMADGGSPMQCGWLTDKFGVSWQVVPRVMGEMMGDKDPKKAARVMQAMMKMVKLDIAALKAAYAQE
jgi:predicted 3-demethylubiquinone-9 3-methyltransferase (glyoxalase superfamily)